MPMSTVVLQFMLLHNQQSDILTELLTTNQTIDTRISDWVQFHMWILFSSKPQGLQCYCLVL